MRKTALAVAVGGLFIAPAAQAQIVFGNETLGTLQLYGKLYPQFSYATSKDPTSVGTSVSTLVQFGKAPCPRSLSSMITATASARHQWHSRLRVIASLLTAMPTWR